MPDIDEQAEKDVKAFLKILERDYGITPENLRWFANYQKSVTRWGDWVAKTIVGTVVASIVGGIGYVLYLGFISALAELGSMLPK